MSQIKMIVKICYIENVPIEQSRFQQSARALGMIDAADRLSYEIELPRDEPCETSTPLSTSLSEH